MRRYTIESGLVFEHATIIRQMRYVSKLTERKASKKCMFDPLKSIAQKNVAVRIQRAIKDMVMVEWSRLKKASTVGEDIVCDIGDQVCAKF